MTTRYEVGKRNGQVLLAGETPMFNVLDSQNRIVGGFLEEETAERVVGFLNILDDTDRLMDLAVRMEETPSTGLKDVLIAEMLRTSTINGHTTQQWLHCAQGGDCEVCDA